MGNERKVLIYGASGYTGKLVSESLAKRNIPFYAAGRNADRLAAELKIVQDRLGFAPDAEILEVSNDVDSLVAAFEKVDVVINVVGPFMQLGKPVVEACLKADCHYLDTTGEQDWTHFVKNKYGQAFADKGLLISPANSYMWAAGAMAAEYVLETDGIDSLDILYQIDNGLPSEASTKSFLRMACNNVDQSYLERNELKPWKNDVGYNVHSTNRSRSYLAIPWGGGCEPIWFLDDARVLNCSVLVAGGDEMIGAVLQATSAFNQVSDGMTQAEKEAWTNSMGEQMDTGEPEKDQPDVQRSVIVCRGQGRQVTKNLTLNLTTPYQFTGEICAQCSDYLLKGELIKPGFASSAQAFGHRKLLDKFHELGFASAVAD